MFKHALTSGEVVILKSGSIARAMRASMFVSAAFAAVEIEGKLLVDGGIANNIPIAVDISTPLAEREELGRSI